MERVDLPARLRQRARYWLEKAESEADAIKEAEYRERAKVLIAQANALRATHRLRRAVFAEKPR